MPIFKYILIVPTHRWHMKNLFPTHRWHMKKFETLDYIWKNRETDCDFHLLMCHITVGVSCAILASPPIHTYIHTCIHTNMHTYVHTYIHTYVYTYNDYTCHIIHCGSCMCSDTYTQWHVYVYMYMYMYRYMYM